MPNWCSNVLELEHSDPEMIIRAHDAFKRGELLNEFVPVPQSLKDTVSGHFSDPEQQIRLELQEICNQHDHGYRNWYDFCVNEWGTKWDVGGNDDAGSPDDGRLTLSFDSAWAPPVAFYEKMTQQGFNVRAYYYEPGCAFCGMFDSEYGDDCYDLSGMDAKEIRETIPEDLDEMFGIADDRESWDNEDNEE